MLVNQSKLILILASASPVASPATTPDGFYIYCFIQAFDHSKHGIGPILSVN